MSVHLGPDTSGLKWTSTHSGKIVPQTLYVGTIPGAAPGEAKPAREIKNNDMDETELKGQLIVVGLAIRFGNSSFDIRYSRPSIHFPSVCPQKTGGRNIGPFPDVFRTKNRGVAHDG